MNSAVPEYSQITVALAGEYGSQLHSNTGQVCLVLESGCWTLSGYTCWSWCDTYDLYTRILRIPLYTGDLLCLHDDDAYTLLQGLDELLDGRLQVTLDTIARDPLVRWGGPILLNFAYTGAKQAVASLLSAGRELTATAIIPGPWLADVWLGDYDGSENASELMDLAAKEGVRIWHGHLEIARQIKECRLFKEKIARLLRAPDPNRTA